MLGQQRTGVSLASSGIPYPSHLHPHLPNAALHKRAASAPAVVRTELPSGSLPHRFLCSHFAQTSLRAPPLGSSFLWIHPTPAPCSHCPHFYSALQRPPGAQLPASLAKHHPPSLLPGFFLFVFNGEETKVTEGQASFSRLNHHLYFQTKPPSTPPSLSHQHCCLLPVRHPHQGRSHSCCQGSRPKPGRVWSWEGKGQGGPCCRPQPGGGCGMQTWPISLLLPGNSWISALIS